MRRWWIWLAGAGALSALLAALLPDLLGAALTKALRAGGFADGRVEITGLGLNETHARVQAGGMDARVVVTHPPSRLLQGWAERITVSGVTVRELPKTGGESSAGGGLPMLPADELLIRDSHLVLAAPGGPLDIGIEADVKPNGSLLAFTATATALGGVTLTAQGRHDPATGAGGAEFRLRPVSLNDGRPDPKPLLPRDLGAVTAVSGTIAARGQVTWTAAGLTASPAEILMEEVGGALDAVSLSGINGVLRFASLSPPVLPDGQELAVRRLDVGLPLTGGTVVLGLNRRGVLRVQRAEWLWAGGVVRARPFEIPVGEARGSVALEAEGLDLGTVLALADLDGLEATGRLSGTLPVRFGDGTVRLDGGVLEAEEPGVLRYDPERPPAALQGDPGSPTGMLMGALTDFRYDSLRATLDGEAGADLHVGLAVRGANPSFYDGHPVALNLKLSGALDQILRRGLDAYRIPDAVRDRILEFQKKGPS